MTTPIAERGRRARWTDNDAGVPQPRRARLSHPLRPTTPVSEGVLELLGDAKQVGFVGVSDLDAAERFYGSILGLDLIDARPFALVHDTPTGQLRITAVAEVRAAPYTVLGWVVSDLEGEVDRLAAAGIGFNRYDNLDQDERGIWTAPDGTRVAWLCDLDGNTLSLHS